MREDFELFGVCKYWQNTMIPVSVIDLSASHEVLAPEIGAFIYSPCRRMLAVKFIERVSKTNDPGHLSSKMPVVGPANIFVQIINATVIDFALLTP